MHEVICVPLAMHLTEFGVSQCALPTLNRISLSKRNYSQCMTTKHCQNNGWIPLIQAQTTTFCVAWFCTQVCTRRIWGELKIIVINLIQRSFNPYKHLHISRLFMQEANVCTFPPSAKLVLCLLNMHPSECAYVHKYVSCIILHTSHIYFTSFSH